jgi:hypothetical membrane protein
MFSMCGQNLQGRVKILERWRWDASPIRRCGGVTIVNPNGRTLKQALGERRPVDAVALRRAGASLVVGVGQFAFFLVISEIYYPSYSVSLNYISDLGATCVERACRFYQPSSSIFDVSILLMGLALFPAAYYVWRATGSRSLSAFLALAGVGAAGVGILNESYGEIHVLFSAWTFIAAGIQALLVYKVARPPYSYFSAVTGIITLTATVLYAANDYLGLGAGGMERVVVYPVLLGGIAFGGYMMALADASPH